FPTYLNSFTIQLPPCVTLVSFTISFIAFTNINPSTKKPINSTTKFNSKLLDSPGWCHKCHPSFNVSYAIIDTTITATIQKRLITLPNLSGNFFEGCISDNALPTNTKPSFTASANECIADANIVPLPLNAAATHLIIASAVLPSAATPDDVFPFLNNFIIPILNLLLLYFPHK